MKLGGGVAVVETNMQVEFEVVWYECVVRVLSIEYSAQGCIFVIVLTQQK